MTLTEKYKAECKLRKGDAEQIKSATDYTDKHLIHSSACDSSSRAQRRVEYVFLAEREIIEKYKKEILQLASKLCIDDI